MNDHEHMGQHKTEPSLGERPEQGEAIAQQPLPEMHVDEDFKPSWLQPPPEPSWFARHTSPLVAWMGVAALAGLTIFGFVWLQNEQKAASSLDVVAQSTRSETAATVKPVAAPVPPPSVSAPAPAPVAAAAQGPTDVPPLVTLPPEEVKKSAVPPLVTLPREEVKDTELAPAPVAAPKPAIARAPEKAVIAPAVRAAAKAPAKPLVPAAPKVVAKAPVKPAVKPAVKPVARATNVKPTVKPAGKPLLAKKTPAPKPGAKKVVAAAPAKPLAKGARKPAVVASKTRAKPAPLAARSEPKVPKGATPKKACGPGDLARDCLN